MSNYAIIRHNHPDNMYYIIQGKTTPTGCPEGVENRDWVKTRFQYLSIGEAQRMVTMLDALCQILIRGGV